jgi:hypothetical protein
MKKLLLLFIILGTFISLQAQVPKTVALTAAGTLPSTLTVDELNTVTDLTVTGNIDARDFRTMRDLMPVLADIDLSGANIVAYSGTEGSWNENNMTYLANGIPYFAFRHPHYWPGGKISLTSIVLPATTGPIYRNAFENCTNITSLTIPSSVTSLGDYAFQNCQNLTSITVGWPVPLNLSSSSGVFNDLNKTICTLNVPYGTASLYSISNQWQDFTNIVEAINGFSLGATTANIGAAANSTASVDLKANVNWTASSDQSWLTVAPASGTESATLTLTAAANTSVATRSAAVTVSASGYDSQTLRVTQEGNDGPVTITAGTLSTMFSANELASIVKLTLTGTIDARDFKTMRDLMPLLAEVDLSGATIVAYSGTEGTSIWNNTSYAANAIPEHAFINSNWQGKTSLTSVVFPLSTTVIGSNAFYGCSSITNISFPSTVSTIGSGAFAFCNGLTAISIPAAVISIQTQAFLASPAVFTVDAANPEYSSLDGVLFNKTQTELIECPTTKTGSYSIPASVVTVRNSAFWRCNNLTSVTIPSSVATLESQVFTDCNGLASITVNRPIPVDLSSFDHVFVGINKTTCILNVPYGTKSIYAAANQWKDFDSIVEAPNGFSLSANTASIGSAANSQTTVELNANVSWVASSDQSWLTVAPASGTASATLTLTAEANASIATRSATITVSATGYDSQTVLVTQDGNDGPVNNTAGTLSTTFSANELASITKLTLSGTIDARDFKTMRDLMPLLAEVDLSGASIVAYTGTEGTYTTGNYTYAANEVPRIAFSNKLSLTSVSIPMSAQVIGRSAFNNCDGLTQVTFGTNSQLTTIGYLSFAYCDKLSNVQVPSTVTLIDYGAFYNCITLNSLTFEPSSQVSSIGYAAFYRCNKLTAINIPATVTSIGDVAFLASIASVTVDANNLNYSSLAGTLYDKNKTRLIYCPPSTEGSFAIPSTVIAIAVDAFYNCSGITSITLPVGLTTLEDWAFENCTGLTTISLPASLSSIGSDALYNCTGLTFIDVNNPIPVNLSSKTDVFFGINKNTCILNVPYRTASLYTSANQWKDFANIVESANGFSLAATSARIGSAAGSTTTVALNANVSWTAASDQAWLTVTPASGTQSSTLTFTAEANTSITTRSATVTVSASGYDSQTVEVTQDGGALNLVTAGTLATILTPEQLASMTYLKLSGNIDARDFKTMRDLMPLLAEVDLRGTTIVTYTGTSGTAGNGNIYYSANIVPQYAFYNYSNGQGKTTLISINLPSASIGIGNYAFSGCANLTSVQFSSSLMTINSYAFRNCSRITAVNIPASVTSIASGAFLYCPGLFTVDNNNTNYSSLEGVLFDKYKTTMIQCPSLKTGTYTIPSSVTAIYSQAFWNCSGLTSIVIPNSVTSIGGGAFTLCSGLTSIVVPMSVSSIGAYAFQNCSNLNSITVGWAVPLDLNSSSDVFWDVNKTSCILHVPYGTRELYASANQWKDFINIVAPVNGFALDKNIVHLDPVAGSTATVLLSANVSWSAVSDQSWLTVSPSSANGDGTVTITVSANPSIEARNAIVTISSSGMSQSITVIQGGANAIKNITAGGLKTSLTNPELASITQLTLTGTIDARDFKTMRDLMPMLAEVDLSGATIVSYTGTEGTLSSNLTYPDNEVPRNAFCTTNNVAKTGLTSIIFPLSINSIGSNALMYCSGITSVSIPSSVTVLGSYIFYNCTNLSSVIFETGSQLISIRDGAFEFCNKLTSITIPSTVTSIGNYVFLGSKTSVTVDAGNANYSGQDGVLYDKGKTIFIYCPTTVTGTFTVPSSVVTIWDEAFYRCVGLSSVIMQSGLNTLKRYAFEGCTGLTSIYLPATVNSIEYVAFLDCSALTTIYANMITPVDLSLVGGAFQNVNKSTCTLIVPAGSVNLYKAAYEWKDFAFIQANQAPVANAGADQTVNKGATVTLDGTTSTDADGNTLTYQWIAPTGITLNSTTTSQPTFTAPNVSVDTQYTFTLKVNDGSLDSEEDQIVVTVLGNLAPVANAGPDQIVNEGALVTLNGSNSSDADEDVLTYAWTAPEGITLSGTTTSNPTFIAPEVRNDTPFTLTLVVNDGIDSSVADQLVVTVKQVNKAPVADAGTTQIVNEGATVSLDGSESTDADGNSLSYNWIAPAGITLGSATSSMPTFVAPMVDKDTDFYFSLSVNDGLVQSSASGLVIITVKDLTHAPVANAGADQTVDEGVTVALDGSASSASNGGNLAYLWTAPAGITLSSNTAVKPTFTVAEVTIDTPYTFLLEVNNGTTTSTADLVVIVVKQVNKVPVADAGATQTVTEGSTVILDGAKSVDADGDVLTYKWTVPEGITLSGTTTANPTFVAPSTATSTTYTFGLTVSDGKADSPQSTVTITVENNWTLIPSIATSSMKIYPNPFTGPVTIDMGESIHGSYMLSIYNIQGSLIIQKEINESKTVINLSDLVPGSYLLKVNSGNNVQSKILIKQ